MKFFFFFFFFKETEKRKRTAPTVSSPDRLVTSLTPVLDDFQWNSFKIKFCCKVDEQANLLKSRISGKFLTKLSRSCG